MIRWQLVVPMIVLIGGLWVGHSVVGVMKSSVQNGPRLKEWVFIALLIALVLLCWLEHVFLKDVMIHAAAAAEEAGKNP